jgi:hypothetical protein
MVFNLPPTSAPALGYPWKPPCPLPLLNKLCSTTPLNALHIELGARMVPFAGYSMPVQYPAGLMAEHHHTRKAAACLMCRTWASCVWSAPMPQRLLKA